MPRYAVTITETLERVVRITADSWLEAEQMVEEQYDKQEVVLDAGDFTGVMYSSEEIEDDDEEEE